MKLKATVEMKVAKARKAIKDKPEAEAAYYQGIVAALDWVLGDRYKKTDIIGFYGEDI